MTKGRPFTDPNFNPPGRPFSDPTHPNYDWFNGGEKPEDADELEEEVEEPVDSEVEEPVEVEDPVIDDKGEPATIEDPGPTPPPEEEVIDKGEPATVESPASEETLFSDSGLSGLLIEEPPVEEELAVATTFALLPEDDIIDAVDPLVPTITGTALRDKIIGTNGDDIIEGGLGADKFKVKKGDDIILDFKVGEDSLKGKFKDIELSSVVGDVGGTLMEHKRGSVLFEGLDLTAVDIFG